MSDHESILDEARPFCDPDTGEVVKRIPDELMQQLRAARLARGIPGRPSSRTESDATWYVFLTNDIAERVLEEWRQANAERKRKRKSKSKQRGAASPQRRAKSSHGLKAFRQRKRE